MKSEQRCVKCIVPKATYGIKFNDEGCCELCLNYNGKENAQNNNEKNLEQKIKDIKWIGKSRSYDCLVGLSGGRDSAYLLYLLVKKHNLRCMAAYHRTPFTPNIIDYNVKKLTKVLNVPLIQMEISNTKHKLFARDMIKLWLNEPDDTIANLACAPCKEHNHEVYKIAREYNIGYIVFGGNKYETFQIGAAQDKNSKIYDFKEITSFQKIKQLIIVAKRGFSILLKRPKLLLSFNILFKNSILYLNNRTPYLRMRYSDIKMLDYYYLAGYDEKAVNRFMSKFHLEIPQNCNSSWRADCAFSEIKNIMFRKRVGMTYNDAYLSNMIRAGALTRDEALKRINVEGKISQERLKEVCEILGIPVEHFYE